MLKTLFRIAIGFLFAVISAWSSHAQLNPAKLTQYTEVNGVPGAEVNKVLVDRQGFIWVGSANGLARFDGYEFKRFYYDPNDTNSIHGMIVWSLYEDSKGQIWVGCGSSFLNVYTPATQTFRRYAFQQLVERATNVEVGISSICEDKAGRIWLGVSTYNGERVSPGLLYIDEKDGQVRRFPVPDSLRLDNVYRITRDQEENLWVLSYSGIFKIDKDRRLASVRPPPEVAVNDTNFFSDVKPGINGEIWFVTNNARLYKYVPATQTYEKFSPGMPTKNYYTFNILLPDKQGNVWMGTYMGLFYFDQKEKVFQSFRDTSKLQITRAMVNDLKWDSFGTLWIATNSEGVLKYEDRAILNSYVYSKVNKNSITSGWASSIYETSDGKLWISTGGGGESGINELDLATGTIRKFIYRNMMPGVFGSNTIYEHSPGEFWLGSNNGLMKFDPNAGKITKIHLEGLPDSATVNYFYHDKKGNFWACTLNGLYRQAKGSAVFKRYDLSTVKESDAGSNEITRAIESDRHGLWLITNNGLFLYDYATDKIVRHGYDSREGDIFVTQDINSFYEDSSGIAWVGTWQGGLSRYDVKAKKIRTYTLNDGLPSMSIQAIIADPKNKALWLSTFDGICRFNLSTGQCNNYTITDGIQGQLFADGAFLKTSKGLFCFGGSNGITIFNPDDITKKSIPPRVMLTDLKLFDKSVIPGDKSILKGPIYETEQIVLPYNQNNISLEFLALHFANPVKNRYSYKLENYDDEWREGTLQRTAIYPKLPPGDYLFKVKAANANGVWNEVGASLKITVLRPWWLAKWAFVLYALVLAGLSFAGYRYLKSRAVKKEREKARAKEFEQAKEIEKAYVKLEQTHESLKAAQAQLIQSEKMASLGELTAGIAHEIQNPLNFVNNFSEVNEELLQEMKEAISSGNLNEANELVIDLTSNMEKINSHGKRADAIVKNMLEHSRIGISQKGPVDLNAMCDEYLRLSYHGMRARDKGFKSNFESYLDPQMGKVEVVGQDIGRVLLNLFNNAFYSVREKCKLNIERYSGLVTVTTLRKEKWVEIRITDNGTGIPMKVVEKIFQPFFTTKPSGQGTGLGLSLSYDIVKAHGGEIRVENNADGGATFVIELPA